MTLEDIYTTLVHLNMIDIHDRVPTPRPLPGQAIKIIKGRKSKVARKNLQRSTAHDDEKTKGSFVTPISYTVSWDPEDVERYLVKWEAKGYLRLNPENLKWSPFLIARTKKSDALPAEDSVPPSATTEAPTPTADVLVSPLAGSSSDVLRLENIFASPALALFDDDNIVEIARRPRTDEDVLVHAESPEDGSQHTPTRSQRQHSSSPILVDVTPRPKRPRRSTTGNVGAMSTLKKRPDRPAVRRTRSAAQVSGRLNDADLIAEDAALAARLAMEEDPPRRQLRSRSNTEQSLMRPISPSTPKSISPRKRKRVESPPSTPTTRQTRSQALQSTPSRPVPSRRSSSQRIPAKRRKPQRRQSRLTKEVINGDEARSVASPEPEPEPEPAAEYEPFQSPTSTLPDQPSVLATDPHADADATSEDKPDAARDIDAMEVEENMVPAHIELVPDDDAVYEDMETPHTGTSRHSVGRTSDDTVYAAEEQLRAADKMTPPAVSAAVVELSIESTAPAALSGQTTTEDALAEDDPDLDAEGEEDIEGELDAEGEDDIDAEGEPDTGEDLEFELDDAY
ncbi:uncharacterized protein PHACADRAFT_158797 [Phanerochaete carnosa HHB-10118-sp]|uniref:Uncharacterized protein n=1 Tax=Phanerochaete carnosa (strain HHB-10118-sp) TaxID=650164 RepID=K5WFA1_PHACS|nr:uncharacterized protein PHACADRAFT_158797 [Phanerochaete carnosa HHB-10118-sp]EKM57759.1 hypothetical protein PHACADRAFT_158797 [Phanerochaete carnosa HHB-10118-sp]